MDRSPAGLRAAVFPDDPDIPLKDGLPDPADPPTGLPIHSGGRGHRVQWAGTVPARLDSSLAAATTSVSGPRFHGASRSWRRLAPRDRSAVAVRWPRSRRGRCRARPVPEAGSGAGNSRSPHGGPGGAGPGARRDTATTSFAGRAPAQPPGDERVGDVTVAVDDLGQIGALHEGVHLVEGEVHDHTSTIAALLPSASSATGQGFALRNLRERPNVDSGSWVDWGLSGPESGVPVLSGGPVFHVSSIVLCLE